MDEIELVERQYDDTAVVRGHVPHDGIGEFLGSAFGQVMAALGPMPPAGPPYARYEMAEDGWDIEAGFPVVDAIEASGDVVPSQLPGGSVATLMHAGAYETLGKSYAALEAWLGEHGWIPDGPPWETYLDGPDAATPRTIVSWPCRRA
jgi:hypothetical protein